MSDQALDIFKLVFLGLLYLFFARVLWAVWSEVRRPAEMSAGQRIAPGQEPEILPASTRAPKGKHGRVGRLVIIEPKHRRGSGIALDSEVTIGRDASCTITIDNDAVVSGVHARVFDLDGQPMVEDLDSTNGSFLNGNRLQGMRLLHRGDRIQVGYTVLEAQ
jgi:pSer/pThr/pTyr-binding forkhead associated (FHA) protein